jgi:hypothetical protein
LVVLWRLAKKKQSSKPPGGGNKAGAFFFAGTYNLLVTARMDAVGAG